MSNKIISLLLIPILFILTVLSSSCGGRIRISSPEPPTQAIAVQKTATISTILPTLTNEMEAHPFLLPVNASEIRDLLPSSASCPFPCFLGIVPGKTDYQTVVSEMSRVATSDTGEVRSFDGKLGYNFKLDYPENDLTLSMDVSTLDKNKVIDLILYPTSTLANYYSVPKIIDTYRSPDNILVFTLREAYGDGVRPFDLILDYSSKGFLLWYRNPDTKIENDRIKLCYRPDIAPTIFLWSPDEKRSFLDIAPIGKVESSDSKPLDSAAKIDSGKASDLLTSSNGFCAYTDINNWNDVTKYVP